MSGIASTGTWQSRSCKACSALRILGGLSTACARISFSCGVVFVAELPHTATGKLSKKTLREKYRNYRLPTA